MIQALYTPELQVSKVMDVSISKIEIYAGVRAWTRAISVQYLGPPPKPAVTGAFNGGFWQQAFAPGMVLSLFGSNLATGTQTAGTLPLTCWVSGALVTVNDEIAPLCYVSPSQVNLQVPYETPPGPAVLTVYSGEFVGTYGIQVAATAPGIFTAANGAHIPSASGWPGQTATLFITGAGQLAPFVSDGSAPSSFPLPAPVSVAVGVTPAAFGFQEFPGDS